MDVPVDGKLLLGSSGLNGGHHATVRGAAGAGHDALVQQHAARALQWGTRWHRDEGSVSRTTVVVFILLTHVFFRACLIRDMSNIYICGAAITVATVADLW